MRRRIAAARCDHEDRCNNIGADEKYSSRNDCMNDMAPEARDAMDDCRYGVDEKDLRECVSALSNEECNAPLQNMKSFKECETDNLCLTESARDRDRDRERDVDLDRDRERDVDLDRDRDGDVDVDVDRERDNDVDVDVDRDRD